MWKIICGLQPQWYVEVVLSFHLYIRWLHFPWPVRSQFSVTHTFPSRWNIRQFDVWICPCGFSGTQSSYHLVFVLILLCTCSFAVFYEDLWDFSHSLSLIVLKSEFILFESLEGQYCLKPTAIAVVLILMLFPPF